MQATRSGQVYENSEVLFVALELSKRSWRLAFGDGSRRRQVKVEGGDVAAVLEAIGEAKRRWRLPAEGRVVSCYEAGRDGFWLDRVRQAAGIENVVVDSASIEVKRQARRAKSDRGDAEKLLGLLLRWWHGERRALAVVRVPPPEAEDLRCLHRAREHAQRQRTRESNRIRGLLVAQGIRIARMAEAAPARVQAYRTGDGRALGAELLAELERAWASYRHFDAQVRAIEAEQRARLRREAQSGQGPYALMALLMQLKAVGLQRLAAGDGAVRVADFSQPSRAGGERGADPDAL